MFPGGSVEDEIADDNSYNFLGSEDSPFDEKLKLHVMAGVKILNPDLMIKILKQGGSGYHLLKECSEKIALIKA